jgi:hypothetical protein
LRHPPIRKPTRIRNGDVVGVIAPSGVLNEERLQTGIGVLEGWGLRVELEARCSPATRTSPATTRPGSPISHAMIADDRDPRHFLRAWRLR